jgi:hypothetical protein
LEVSFPYQQTAGFLAHSSGNVVAFPISQWLRFPPNDIQTAYSDEFAQALHLFPFYPFFSSLKMKGTGCFHIRLFKL